MPKQKTSLHCTYRTVAGTVVDKARGWFQPVSFLAPVAPLLPDWISIMRPYLAVFLAFALCIVTAKANSDLEKYASLDFHDFQLQRASLAETIILNNTWTNASFAEAVCNLVGNSLTVQYVGQLRFEVPDCLYDLSLQSLSLQNILFPNITRLPTSLRTFHAFSPSGNFPETWDWEFLSLYPQLHTLGLVNMRISGSLPPCVNLESLIVPYNRLSGEIPENFFNCSSQLYWLDVSSNQLTGAIPHTSLEKMLWLDLRSNKLTHWPDPVHTNASNPASSANAYALQQRAGANPES